jgi:hypothetical protein
MTASRSLSSRIGALTLHATHDTAVISAPGRVAAAAALDNRLLHEIDEREPGLPEAERQRRLGYLRRAHFARLAVESAKARRRKRAK